MSSVPAALVRATRPRQWVKNVLVLGAPIAAGRLLETDVLIATLWAVLAFVLTSSGLYLVNDVLDVEDDRRHPTKRLRPIAAGELPVRLAWIVAVVLVTAGVATAFAITVPLGLTIAAYAALQLGYCFSLKHQPVIDLAIVASGFLLRAIAGGAATHIPLSRWFLLVAAFGSLFMVAGKRYSEIHVLGTEAGTRRSLVSYSESYLRFVWSLAAAVSITFYSLWAYQSETARTPWSIISIAPFTLGLLRYAVDVDRGFAGSPEDIAFRDRALQALGATWLVLVCLGVAGVPFPS